VPPADDHRSVNADLDSNPRGKALVRVIQASLRQHRVTVSAGRQVLAGKEAFARVTSRTA